MSDISESPVLPGTAGETTNKTLKLGETLSKFDIFDSIDEESGSKIARKIMKKQPSRGVSEVFRLYF